MPEKMYWSEFQSKAKSIRTKPEKEGQNFSQDYWKTINEKEIKVVLSKNTIKERLSNKERTGKQISIRT